MRMPALRPLLAAVALLLGACGAQRRAPVVAVDRLAELDRHHGFQDLAFNQPCADQVTLPATSTPGEFGLDRAALSRTARVAPRVRGAVTVGCYRDMLGLVEVQLQGKADVRRVRRELLELYGTPTRTEGPVAASWRGERVAVRMEISPEGDAAVLRYRSLLSEALWRRDVHAQAPRPPRHIGPSEPEIFVLSEGGVF